MIRKSLARDLHGHGRKKSSNWGTHSHITIRNVLQDVPTASFRGINKTTQLIQNSIEMKTKSTR